jgi:HD-like signal output (HDOD) protein
MFGGLFGKSKSKNGNQAIQQLSPAISSSILSAVGSQSIPPMPGAAHKAFQLAIDPNAEARDFIEVIEADEALAARVLRIANSVFYDRGKTSASIEESVTVIGINELRCLLNANTLSDIFPCRHPARTQLWANDIATALIAKQLSLRLLPSKVSTAFLAGLMHDLGKLLLLQRNTEEYVKILNSVESKGVSFKESEGLLYPFDHTEVGQLIAERWKFSDELIDAIRNHHQPWPQGQDKTGTVSLACLVKAADLMAHALGLGHPRGFARLQHNCEAQLEEAWAWLAVPTGEQKPLLAQCKRTFEIEYDLYAGNIGK